MPRIARAVVKGYPYHVTQRGNYRQSVFESEGDYLRYKAWLTEYSQRFGLKIWAYCLMTNHVHFVCVPLQEDSLARMFNTLHMRYAQYFHKKQGLKGHLWQGRFFSCVLDEQHLQAAIRYVENNPVRANIVDGPEKYPWSSTLAHIKMVTDPIVSDDCSIWTETKDWLEFLRNQADEEFIEDIRKHSLTGRPCGDDEFITRIEGLLGRPLRAKKWGRPGKRGNNVIGLMRR